METTEINAVYDHLTTPAHASMYLLRRKVATTLPDHIGSLLKMARKCNCNNQTLKELEEAASRHPSQ
jgi:hypothetical protein